MAGELSYDSVAKSIEGAIKRVLNDSGRPLPDSINSEDSFATELKLDSLDLAVLVVNLESELGVDPFRTGVAPVRTFGELVAVYVSASQTGNG